LKREKRKNGKTATEGPRSAKRKSRDAVLVRWFVLLLFSAFPLFRFSALASAQTLAGPWVEQAQAAIEEHRQTPIRVLVLDAEGEPAAGAAVHLRQLKHDFPLGFVVPSDGWPERYRAGDQVWRIFNTASLERHTRWADLEDDGGAFDAAQVAEVARPAEAVGLELWWGPVISADPGRNPGRLFRLERQELGRALAGQVDRIVGVHGRRAAAFDLYANTLDHDLIESHFGEAKLRRLFDRADAIAPDASLRLRMTDVLGRRRSLDAVRQVAAHNEALIAFDALALEQHYTGRIEHSAVRLGLTRLEGLGVPIVFASLEVTGEQPLETAVSLETVVRVLYASPRVAGICFAGVTPKDAAAPGAALFDERGEPTAAGSVLDSLFTRVWRTDERVEADELGNVYHRVFPGRYRVTATLADGTKSTSVAHVPKADEARLLVLQPDAPAGPASSP